MFRLILILIATSALAKTPDQDIKDLTKAITELSKAIREHKKAMQNSAFYNDKHYKWLRK